MHNILTTAMSFVMALAFCMPVSATSHILKKKIAIISMRRGGAHTSAAQALKQQLSEKYEVTIVNVFEDVLSSLDVVQRISRKKYTGDDFYVGTCRTMGNWAVAPLQAIGKFLTRNQSDKIAQLLEQFLRKGEYALVISVIPYINYAIYRAARGLGIPSFVLMLNLDADHWLNDMQTAYITQFTYGLCGESIAMRTKLFEKNMPSSCVAVVGFPIKQNFLTPADVPELKREFGISANKPVIMVMMGAEGTSGNLFYARALAQSTIPIHVCFCIGRDERARPIIDQLKPQQGVTFSVVGFTDRIADYMAVADVLITKPGIASIFEAISRRLPMIIDHIDTVLPWEIPHINFVVQHNFGFELRDIKQLPHILHCFLQDPTVARVIKQSMEQYAKSHVHETILSHVDALLEPKR